MISLPDWITRKKEPEKPDYYGLIYAETKPREPHLDEAFRTLFAREMTYRQWDAAKQMAYDIDHFGKDHLYDLALMDIGRERLGHFRLSLKQVATYEAWLYMAGICDTRPAKVVMCIYTLLYLRALNPRRITIQEIDMMWKRGAPDDEAMRQCWLKQKGPKGNHLDTEDWWGRLSTMIRSQTPDPHPDIVHYPILP